MMNKPKKLLLAGNTFAPSYYAPNQWAPTRQSTAPQSDDEAIASLQDLVSDDISKSAIQNMYLAYRDMGESVIDAYMSTLTKVIDSAESDGIEVTI